MEIPQQLLNEMRSGRVVLFLGAGASIGAKNKNGESPPLGLKLAEILHKKFIGGNYKNETLTYISELSISESDLYTVQDYIKSVFEEIEPADFHLLVPSFKWRSIITTNYDLIIEKSYNKVKKPLQGLAKFVSNKDRIDDKLRSTDDLPFLKLHGCITRTHDIEVPLILTPDQYVTYKKGRSRLFQTFEEWGHEYSIVFIGSGLQDSNLREILYRLEKLDYRPKYYLVSPDLEDIEIRMWEKKRITVLKGTFENFLELMNQEIPSELRVLQKRLNIKQHLIENKFEKNIEMSRDCIQFLENEVYYVHPEMAIEKGSPKKFYKGFNFNWYPIDQELDVRRQLTDVLLYDKIFALEEERPTIAELYVIKAEAGAGKSVFLKRLAWESSIEGALCIFLKHYGNIDYEVLHEIYRLTNERIFFFIDDASDNSTSIENIIIKARKDKLPLTIITAERVNEWNMGCESLNSYISEEYKLRYLNDSEIRCLVDLLEKYECLGHLEEKTIDERIEEFQKRAGRQILVALHEATLGRPYEDILVNEYNEIRPQLAQSLYLSVCVLNRLNVYVRAGLISRVYDIPFKRFKEKFFAPLEHVVQIVSKPSKDYYYKARHTRVAEIVFERILTNKVDRYDHYIRLLNELNISYSSDREAYRQLIKASVLLKLFPDYQDANEVYNIAHQIAFDDPYLYHQHGIYEMKRVDGNYNKAYDLLMQAREIDEKDSSIIHSLSELYLIKADNEDNSFRKEQYYEEARKYAISLLQYKDKNKYAIHTIIKIMIAQLEDKLNKPDSNEREIDELINNIETHFEQGLQRFPGDSYLLSTESRFRQLLDDKEKALIALEKAYKSNNRNPFIASRLSKIYQVQGDNKNALKTIQNALESNPGEMKLHYRYAILLIENKAESLETLIYHLKRSFTKNDQNYEAQFWYARYCFVTDDLELVKESKEIFRYLRESPIPHEVRTKIRSQIKENGSEKTRLYTGTIKKKEETFGFIEREGYGDELFMHIDYIGDAVWRAIKQRDKVVFNIGFNFGGPIAFNIKSI